MDNRLNPYSMVTSQVRFASKWYDTHGNNKTKLTADEIAAFKARDEVAKRARAALPRLFKLYMPLPDSKKGIVAKHSMLLQDQLKALPAFCQAPKLQSDVDNLLENGVPSEPLNAQETSFLANLDQLTQLFSRSSDAGMFPIFDRKHILDRMPKGILKDLILVDMSNGALREAAMDHLADVAHDSNKAKMILTAFSSDTAAPLKSRYQAAGAVLDGFQDPAIKHNLIQQLLINYSAQCGVNLDAGYDAQAHAGLPRPSELIARAALGDASSVANLIGQIPAGQEKLAPALKVLTEANAAIALPDLTSLVKPQCKTEIVMPEKTIDGVNQVLHQYKETGATTSNTADILVDYFKAFPDKAALQQWVDKALSDGDVVNPVVAAAALAGSEDEEIRGQNFSRLMIDRNSYPFVGEVLNAVSGMFPEKQVYVQAISSTDNDTCHKYVATLLNGPLPDSVKMAVISSLSQQRETSNRVMALMTASTISSPVLRNSMLNALQRNHNQSWPIQYAKKLQTIETLDDQVEKLNKEPEAMAFVQMADSALAPYAKAGLPIAALKPTLDLIEAAGMDAGTLNKEIIPGFATVVSHALSHPEKLVKAGKALPNAAEINRQFYTDHAPNLLKALVLLGPAPLKNIIDQKRLPHALALSKQVADHTELVPKIAQLSRRCVDPYDAIKILELSSTYLENESNATESKNQLSSALDEVLQQNTVDLAPLTKGCLKQIMKKVGIEDLDVDASMLDKWNLRHINTLAAGFRSMDTKGQKELADVVRATMENKYEEYLYKDKTPVGEANKATQKLFKEAGLNYDQWLHFDKVMPFTMPSRSQYLPTVVKAFNQVLTDLHAQLHPKKGKKAPPPSSNWESYVINNLTNYHLNFKDGALVNSTDKPVTTDDISHINTALSNIVKNYAYYGSAQDSMSQRLKTLQGQVGTLARLREEPEELEVGLWGRQPGYDLFMGTDTGACTSLSGGSISAVDAVQHTFIQMIHLRRPGEKNSVGKILAFWINNPNNNKKALIWNTFEGRGGGESQYEHNTLVRDKMMEFMESYAKAVSGQEATPIRMGTTLNPSPVVDLDKETFDLDILGRTRNNDSYYLDAVDSGTYPNKSYSNITMYNMNRTPLHSTPEEISAANRKQFETTFPDLKLNYKKWINSEDRVSLDVATTDLLEDADQAARTKKSSGRGKKRHFVVQAEKSNKSSVDSHFIKTFKVIDETKQKNLGAGKLVWAEDTATKKPVLMLAEYTPTYDADNFRHPIIRQALSNFAAQISRTVAGQEVPLVSLCYEPLADYDDNPIKPLKKESKDLKILGSTKTNMISGLGNLRSQTKFNPPIHCDVTPIDKQWVQLREQPPEPPPLPIESKSGTKGQNEQTEADKKSDWLSAIEGSGQMFEIMQKLANDSKLLKKVAALINPAKG